VKGRSRLGKSFKSNQTAADPSSPGFGHYTAAHSHKMQRVTTLAVVTLA
jgi:hypothetical protein